MRILLLVFIFFTFASFSAVAYATPLKQNISLFISDEAGLPNYGYGLSWFYQANSNEMRSDFLFNFLFNMSNFLIEPCIHVLTGELIKDCRAYVTLGSYLLCDESFYINTPYNITCGTIFGLGIQAGLVFAECSYKYRLQPDNYFVFERYAGRVGFKFNI